MLLSTTVDKLKQLFSNFLIKLSNILKFFIIFLADTLETLITLLIIFCNLFQVFYSLFEVYLSYSLFLFPIRSIFANLEPSPSFFSQLNFRAIHSQAKTDSPSTLPHISQVTVTYSPIRMNAPTTISQIKHRYHTN